MNELTYEQISQLSLSDQRAIFRNAYTLADGLSSRFDSIRQDTSFGAAIRQDADTMYDAMELAKDALLAIRTAYLGNE